VNGVSYDVTMHTSFDEASHVVHDYEFSQTATRVLYQLFSFGEFSKTIYNRNPVTAKGCTSLSKCNWATVYGNDELQLFSYAFMNHNPDYNRKNTNKPYPIKLSIEGNSANTTYLQWSKSVQSIQCSGFEVPLNPENVNKDNEVLLLKAILQEDNTAVSLSMLMKPPVIIVNYFSAPDANPVDVSDKVFSVRFADNGRQFFYSEGQWEYILSTKSYTKPGTYKISMASGNLSEYVIDEPGCNASFVVPADKKKGVKAKIGNK